ncbi:MAG TPA: dolichyl-phosphate beta-glucosyltransferase [Ktedonobacterales bacterium]|nr:dolichyl-phosphate beta-glucosyltransferase [Ktedonobacterales bacterium]
MTERGMSAPEISIVIPAFNEARRLPESIARLKAYQATRPRIGEVIVVDDGSTDGTSSVVEGLAREWPMLRLVRAAHRGKGGAVRVGVLEAAGTYIALADADFSMPVEQFDRFSAPALGAYDIAIGSREAPGARRFDEPGYRHLMGRGFNALVRVVLLPGIQDTQCGFKCMRRDVAIDLCQHQTIDGWGFDVELLYIARLRGYRVVEVPVSWYYAPGSRVNPIRDTVTMVRDVLTIRRNGKRGCYDIQTVTVPAQSQMSR